MHEKHCNCRTESDAIAKGNSSKGARNYCEPMGKGRGKGAQMEAMVEDEGAFLLCWSL